MRYNLDFWEWVLWCSCCITYSKIFTPHILLSASENTMIKRRESDYMKHLKVKYFWQRKYLLLSNILSVIDMIILNSWCPKNVISLFLLLVNGRFMNGFTWPWGISYTSLKEVLLWLKTFPYIFCTLRKGSYVLLVEPKNKYMLWSPLIPVD